MKLTLSLFLICSFTPALPQSPTQPDSTLLKILILESFDSVWGALDKDNIQKYYTDEFLLLEHG
jgi:hypothetical protein